MQYSRFVVRVARFLSVSALTFAFVAVVAAMSNPCLALPPLISIDQTSRDSDRPFEQHIVGDINVFTKTLDGRTLAAGPLVLEYDEAYGPPRAFGNFELKGIVFLQGTAVLVPALEQRGGTVDNVALIDGVRSYPMRKLFTGSATPPPGVLSVTRVGYSLQKHGRFYYRLRTDQLPTGLYSSRFIHDTATETAYFFPGEPGGPTLSGKLRPNIALLPGGYEVTFLYTGAGELSSATLRRNNVVIETLSLTYVQGKVTLASSNVDPARQTKYTYATAGNLEYVLRGGNNTTAGSIGGYKLLYTTVGDNGAPLKDVITGLETLNGKQVVRYFLSQASTPFGARTIYSGVQHGPPTVNSTTFAYLPNNQVQVTPPIEQGKPLTLTLEPNRGILLKVETSVCPQPLQEIELITAPGPREGLIYREFFRPRCDSLVTRTFYYTTSGRLTNVDLNIDGQSRYMSYQYKNVQLPNGVSASRVKKIGAGGGDYTAWDYSDNGKLNSVSLDYGAITTNYSYDSFGPDWWNAEKVHTIHPTGREDVVRFDEQGRLIEVVESVGTAAEVSRSITDYNALGRVERHVDEKGNSTLVTYRGNTDERIGEQEITSANGSEMVRVAYSYDTSFPGYVTSEDGLATDLTTGNTKRVVTQYQYRPDFPLLEKVTLSNSLTPQFTLESAAYDPTTLRVTQTCGFSEQLAVPRSCTTYSYKGAGAGILQGHLDVITNPEGYTTAVQYDGYGNFAGVLQQRDETTTIQTELVLDGAGRLKRETINPNDPQYEHEKEYFYDPYGKLSRTTVREGGRLTSDLQYTYDQSGRSFRPIRVDDAFTGMWRVLEYADPLKRLTRSATYSPAGLVLVERGVNSTDYDRYNRALRERVKVEGVGEIEVTKAYNQFGELEEASDGRGNLTTYQYDDFGRLKLVQDASRRTSYSYGIDSAHRRISTAVLEHLTSDPNLDFVSSTTYASDMLGRMVEVQTLPANIRSQITYQPNGWLEQITTSYLPSGGSETFQFAHDGLGRVIQLAHDNEILWEREFNAISQLTATRDARLNETRYFYDLLGRPIETQYPGAAGSHRVESVSYTTQGNKLVEIQTQSDHGYAGFNRLGQSLLNIVVAPQGTYAQFFDYIGDRLSTITSSENSFVTEDSIANFTEYDDFGRPVAETISYSLFDTAYGYTLEKTFDTLGSLTGHIYPDGTQVEYQRDSLGRVSNIVVDGVPTATYTYDGEFVTSLEIGGVVRTFQYDPELPLLRRITDRVGTTIIGDVQFGYDSKFRLMSKTDYGPRDWDESFTYSNHHMVETHQVSSPTRLGGTTIDNVFGPELDGVLTGILYPTVNEVFELTDAFSYDGRGRPISNQQGDFIRYYWSVRGLSIVTGEVEYLTLGQDALGRYMYCDGLNSLGNPLQMLFAWDEGMPLWQELRE